ncbi:phage tail spike protein [Bacillus cereus]
MSNNDLHIFDFKTEQIIAVIKEQDYWDDSRKWELKNNVDRFEFTVSDGTHKAAKLMQQNIVLKRVRDGSFVSYVINESEQDSVDRSKKIYALSEHTKLRKAKVIKPQTIESYTVNKWMDFALEGTKWQRGVTEYASFRTIHIKEFTNPLDLLKTIASTFELEIRFRTEVQGSFIVGRYVDMVRKVGRDNGKEIVLGKDLQGIRRIENSQDAISALVGVGPFNEETGEYLTFEKINGGKLYVADADALQRWTEDGSHKYDIYSPQTEDQNMSPERLKQLTEAELKKRINSTVQYEVASIALEKIFGLSHEKVNKGDIVHIKDTKFTPPLFLEARLIAADECDTNAANDKYYFGDFKEVEDTRSLLDRMYAQVMGSLAGKANKELLNQLEKLVQETNEKVEIVKTESQTAKDIATKTKEYMEQNLVEIIENANPPTINLKPNKTLWRDISNGKPGTLKIWTGTTWELVVPDTGPLQQSINDAQIEIDTLKNTVKDLPDTTWINQQLEGKADKSGVYTKDYIDQNLVGKQVYETDKQGNIQKFTDMKTEIDQNAEAITHKAEKTQVDTISNNLNQVTQTANTAKQTAESNTNTISSLQTTVSNINDNVTNLLVDSGTFEGAKTTTPLATDRWWFKNNGQVRLSADIYQGNAVIETQTAWNSLAYNFKDLVSRGVVKAGDKVNYSVCVRVKNLANGQSAQQNFYFRTGATGIRPPNATNQWQRVSVSFTITPDMMTVTGTSTDSFMRIEPDVAQTGTVWYQQSTPQLTIGEKVYTWRPAPEDNATFVKKSNEIKQTVDSNVATIQSIQKDQGSMQSTLNEVKQTTDSNSQTIKTLSQTQGQQGEIIQQNTSNITQLNNQIKNTVTDTQMQEYVGGLGSTNILFNAAFEDRVINASTGVITSRTPSVAKWDIWANGTNFKATPESARNHDGFNSVKLETTGLTANAPASFYQSSSSQANSGDHIFSAWFYTDNKSLLDGGAFMEVSYYNGGSWVASKDVQLVPLLVNNSWIFVSATLPAPATAHNSVRGSVTINRNGRLWISQPQLQKGRRHQLSWRIQKITQTMTNLLER